MDKGERREGEEVEVTEHIERLEGEGEIGPRLGESLAEDREDVLKEDPVGNVFPVGSCSHGFIAERHSLYNFKKKFM